MSTFAIADGLSSIVWHPTLSVIYGVAGRKSSGSVYAWEISDDTAVDLSTYDAGAGEREPCHLAVTQDGRLLAVANYISGEIALWPLSATGAISGPPHRIRLDGSGADPIRQSSAHPHQITLSPTDTGIRIRVPDLGSDVLREFEIVGSDPSKLRVEVLATYQLPAGTGPRHMITLPDGRIALSGELASTLVLLTPLTGEVVVSGSTLRKGPAKSRSPRNYPGDLQAAPDGKIVYLANRGYDTVSIFDVSGTTPQLLQEFDPDVAWPQHMHVTVDTLTIAGSDSSSVAAFRLDEGVPKHQLWRVQVPNPAWVIPAIA